MIRAGEKSMSSECMENASDEKRRHLFYRIKFLDAITEMILDCAFRSGFENIYEHVDLNCGAIPDGSYDEAVDPNAPDQFLSMYVQIAENRFACAVTVLLNHDERFMEVLSSICRKVGEGAPSVELKNAFDALSVLDYYVLDVNAKSFLEKSDERISWTEKNDAHESAWKKFGGNVTVYHRLLETFANAILRKQGFVYRFSDTGIFEIAKSVN